MAKHKMQIGFAIYSEGVSDKENIFELIPSDSTLLTASVVSIYPDFGRVPVPLVSCKDLFSDVDDLSERNRNMITYGSCIDPETALVRGTEIFDNQFRIL